MANVLGFDVPFNLPTFGVGTGKIMFVFAIFIFVLVGCIITYLVYQARLFNRRIVVFENISGQGFQPTYKDRARLIKLGDGGEELLFLKKKKVYRTAYGRKMGKNTYWFAVGQDGYWYNCVLGDIDAKMGMLDIEPIDRDMRNMHVAVRKNIQDRYKKVGMMEKYAPIIMNGFFLLIMLVGLWFLLDKLAGISANISGAVQSAAQVQDATRQIVAGLDNICGGGSGIVGA